MLHSVIQSTCYNVYYATLFDLINSFKKSCYLLMMCSCLVSLGRHLCRLKKTTIELVLKTTFSWMLLLICRSVIITLSKCLNSTTQRTVPWHNFRYLKGSREFSVCTIDMRSSRINIRYDVFSLCEVTSCWNVFQL